MDAPNIPVVILCGGMGTRLREETEYKPKPMVEVGGRPILWHIMKHYSGYGFNEFILALGYKGNLIKRYFMDYYTLDRDFTVSLADGKVRMLNDSQNGVEPWLVHLVDTGEATLTGGRLKQLLPLVGPGAFMMTYGDGVADVDLTKLLAFHRSHSGLVTLTSVRPPARFGALAFEGDQIRHFKEKSTLSEGWINGGFFVIEPKALDYIQEDVMWEHAPMERLATDGQLYGYQHEGFWQCMDTLRDLRYLESLWERGGPPWKTW
jgi:glucose-1-phosphate cytidylyltransferase